MKLNRFEALLPTNIEEAKSFLRKYKDKAVVKAGGTALIPEMKCGLKAPEYVVLLNDVVGLSFIEEMTDGLHIGAMTSLHEIKNDKTVKKNYPALAEAAEAVSAPGLHYQSTIGGNICQNTRCLYYNQSEFWRRTKEPCFKLGGEVCLAVPAGKRCQSVFQGDITPVLICLDAKVRVVSPRKEEVLGIKGLYTNRGAKPLRLAPNQFVSEIIIPPAGEKKCVYEKLRERGSLDYPLLGVAASIEKNGDKVMESKFVVTAMASGPIEISEPFLRSRALDDAFIDDAVSIVFKKVRPVANLSSSPAYRKKMTKVLVEQALRRCIE
jgi:4-hydroxybenzoyl-CoA reductase subunit beta